VKYKVKIPECLKAWRRQRSQPLSARSQIAQREQAVNKFQQLVFDPNQKLAMMVRDGKNSVSKYRSAFDAQSKHWRNRNLARPAGQHAPSGSSLSP
jgi:hypothetical protein